MSDGKMGKKSTQELQRKLLTSNVDIVFHKTRKTTHDCTEAQVIC